MRRWPQVQVARGSAHKGSPCTVRPCASKQNTMAWACSQKQRGCKQQQQTMPCDTYVTHAMAQCTMSAHMTMQHHLQCRCGTPCQHQSHQMNGNEPCQSTHNHHLAGPGETKQQMHYMIAGSNKSQRRHVHAHDNCVYGYMLRRHISSTGSKTHREPARKARTNPPRGGAVVAQRHMIPEGVGQMAQRRATTRGCGPNGPKARNNPTARTPSFP